MDDHNDIGNSNLNLEADTTIHNSSLDLLEQQQAIEQARLLNRFRELRSWQQKQQEQLMLQQQTQLELLREEQAKVQNALKFQRQQQWGAGTVKTSSLSIKSSNHGESVRFATGISELVNTVIPTLPPKQNGVMPVNKQHTLPKPVIFEDSPKEEDDNYTNPELFSNPGSMDQLEDGIFQAYDTGSELSNPSSAQQLTLQNLLQSASPETLKAMMAMIPRSRLLDGDADLSPRAQIRHAVHGASPKAKSRQANPNQSPCKFRDIKISPRQRLNKSPSPRSSGSVITELDRKGDMVNAMAQQNGYHPSNASPRLRDKTRFDDLELPQNVKRHLFTEDDDDKDSIDSEVIAALDEMNWKNNYYQKMAASVPASEKEADLDRRSDKDSEDSEPESPNNNHKFAVSIDDRPIKPGLGVGGKKTFEQLLEEQLLEEERKILEEEVVESPSSKKKPFLKRGQGLSRFMGNKKVKETQTKSKPTEVKFKQPEKPAPVSKEKRKNDPSAGPLSNTAKSNQVSKPGTKPKPSQLVPKTVSNQSNNSLHLTQTLKLNPKSAPKPSSSNVPKCQISSNVPQKTTAASNIQSHTQFNQTTRDNQSAKPGKLPTVPSETKEVTSVSVKPNLDPFDDDSSFAEAVRTRIANEGKEQEELAEFELLEDFADNASFCSNSSIVVKLLQSDKNIKSGEPLVGLKGILEARQKEKLQKLQQIPEQSAPMVQQEEEEEQDDTIVDENITDITSDTLTDSDSSISSDSVLDDQDIQFLTAKLNLHQNQAFTKNNQNGNQIQFKGQESIDSMPAKSLTRKIASRDGVPSVSTSSADMKSLLQRLTASKGPHISSLMNSVSIKTDSSDVHKDLDKQDSDSESEESTSEEDDDEDDDDKKSNDYVNDFDDEEEWTDNAPKPKSTGINEKKTEDKLQSTPPTSKLVARLFPNLNQQQQQDKLLKQQQEAEKLQGTKQSDGLQSKILRDKLAQLEIEIERFRNENSVLDKLRKEREEGLAKLKKEINDFEKEKSDELKRLEEFKNQEMKKLKHERKMFEKYQKTIRSMPDKKDREEIDMLKNQVSELQEEMKKKETRWTSSQTRLKDKLELVELENKELKDEIKLLEKRRIEWMQKEAAATSSSQKVMEKGHQSYPRSSTPTKETEDKRPNVNNHHISPPRSQAPLQKKSVVNQIKQYETASKSLSLTTDSIPTLHQSIGDPQPRTQPTKITRSSENSSTSLSTSTSALSSSTSTTTTGSVPRKLASRLLLDNPTIDKGNKQYEESQHSDGKIERIYKNGAREILFANGTRKEISSDGQSIVVSFFNGDIKQIYPDKRVVYYYADAQTSHTTYPDSLEVLQFQNGQIEKHYPDGTKEITFPDQTVKYLFPNGSEESIFPDGTVIRVDVNGDKTMEFPNGQREIHNSQYKRREYPDGTVKTVYPDGRQETRYSTGRVRLKDREGNVIMDRIC